MRAMGDPPLLGKLLDIISLMVNIVQDFALQIFFITSVYTLLRKKSTNAAHVDVVFTAPG